MWFKWDAGISRGIRQDARQSSYFTIVVSSNLSLVASVTMNPVHDSFGVAMIPLDLCTLWSFPVHLCNVWASGLLLFCWLSLRVSVSLQQMTDGSSKTVQDWDYEVWHIQLSVIHNWNIDYSGGVFGLVWNGVWHNKCSNRRRDGFLNFDCSTWVKSNTRHGWVIDRYTRYLPWWWVQVHMCVFARQLFPLSSLMLLGLYGWCVAVVRCGYVRYEMLL